jgi:ribosomal protein L11 methyltransferase
MRSGPLWQLAVDTSVDAEEAVTELLTGVSGVPASSFTNLEAGTTSVFAFLTSRSSGRMRAVRRILKEELDGITRCGLDIGSGRVTVRLVKRRDWAEAWKRHFKPIEIGTRLLVKPNWSKRRARSDQAAIILDPGLSFGTGHHPTTVFCLNQVVRHRRPGEAQSCLDLGCGSGILAIAAARLGYAPVEAMDFDPDAVRIARENARRNGLLNRIRFQRQDVRQLTRTPKMQHALVCANLMADLLLEQRGRILARLARGGSLVLAGILKTEFEQVQRAYEAAGLRLLTARTEREWRSGCFVAQRRDSPQPTTAVR